MTSRKALTLVKLARLLIIIDLQLLWMARAEIDDSTSYQTLSATTIDPVSNDTEIDIEETLSTDGSPLINAELNATESNGSDRPSDDVTTLEQIIPEEKSDYVTLEQLTTTESVWASSTGKDSYTMTDFVDNYETTEGQSTVEPMRQTTTIENNAGEDQTATEEEVRSTTEYADDAKTSIANTSSGKSFINASTLGSDDKFVKISFVTNNPYPIKSQTTTTDRMSTISDEDADKIFKFWTSLSVKSTAPKIIENNMDVIHDKQPFIAHIVTIPPELLIANESKNCNHSSENLSSNDEDIQLENFAKIGYDIDLDFNKSEFSNETEDVSSNYDTSDLSDEEVNAMEAADYGLKKMKELYEIEEPKLYKMGLWLEADNPARFVATFNWQSEEARKFAKYGYASLQASARLKQKLDDELESREDPLEKKSPPPRLGSLKQSALRQQCPLRGVPRCPPASKRYRTHDGTCNNPRRGRWGSALTPVERFLPPRYEDEVNTARGTDNSLPSPRLVSSRVHTGRRRDATAVSHLLMQWGQFLDHDITSSSQARAFNGSIPRCCLDGGRHFVPQNFLHPDCMPIEVPEDDAFYGPLGIRCLEFVRSSPAPRVDCEFGWREQMNQVTSYIDASPIYSSSARQADKLRLFRNGLLQYGRAQARRPLLPPREEDEESLCQGGAVDASCFKAGDGRVNEHPGLVATHIIWLRKHNRLATELGHLNPHWSDEKIYQETRKIIGALIQQITYREFLPIILGAEVMRLFDLELVKKGYYKGYSSKANPSPANAFGAAAFRFGHSLVQDSFMRYDRFHRPLANNVSLHDELSNPTNIWSFGAVDRLVLGMCNQPSQKRDEFITPELTNHLFQTSRFGFGMDLAAINIQRGRDHGLPPYVEWREPCGLTEVVDWSDLYKIMPPNTIRNLQDVYRHVDDIDLFTGGMAERPVVGGLVGPTFACIIAQQFANLRRGDRFWYENGGFESSFTPAQLQQIRRVTFAQILCQTLESIDTIQPFVFLTVDDFRNERIPCTSTILNNFDLTPWTERDIDFNNNVNDFDRTNFIKSSSSQPRSTSDTPINVPKTTDDSLINESNNVKISANALDDKLDLPNRLVTTTPSTTAKTTRTFLSNLHNFFVQRRTTETPSKLDDKLDLSFTHNAQHKISDSSDDLNELQSQERRSFSSHDAQNFTVSNRSISDSNSTEEFDGAIDSGNQKGLEKTYGFLLNDNSQLPFLGNIFNGWKTTTSKPIVQSHSKPQFIHQSYDTYSTSSPNKFTYLINIVPKTTPKYEPDNNKETIKITVQGPTKTRPQINQFPYDKRPVYDNNKLEYRPTNTYYQNSFASDGYDRPQHHQSDFGSSNYGNGYYSNSNQHVSSDSVITVNNNRPYRPYKPSSYPYTTEFNPYSLVTFSHIETTKRYNLFNPYETQHDTHYSQNRPTKPTLTDFINGDDYGHNSKPVATQSERPPGTGITIFIENKPTKPKPNDSPSFGGGNGYGSFATNIQSTENSGYSNSDETIPLFSRPTYQRPLFNRPVANVRPYNYYKPAPTNHAQSDNAYDVPLLSEHGHFSQSNKNKYSYISQDDLYNKKTTVHPLSHVSPTNLNINLASDSGTQHHTDISIVIDSNLQNKANSKPNDYHKSYTTAKTPVKFYYIGNVLHKYPDNSKEEKTASSKIVQPTKKNEILRENYNNVWKPNKEEHELYYDPSEDPYEETVEVENDSLELNGYNFKSEMKEVLRDNQRSKDDKDDVIATIKRETPIKSQNKLKNNDHVFFDVIPSENSPMTWMIYNERPDISDGPFNIMPSIASDPNSSKELPRPINFAAASKKSNDRRHSVL